MPVPEIGYATEISTRPTNLSVEREPFHTHRFVGGNTHTLEILLAFRSLLGIEGFTSVEGLEAEIAATRAQLEDRTAELAIETVTTSSGRLNIPVRITNKTGHKLPTGFPSRRVWVHLKVTDQAGAVVFESGLPDAEGRISTDARALQDECLVVDKTVSGFDYSSCYEPHHDVITSADDVAIYESVLGDVNGDVTYVLLHADEYVKDNRIPPLGFRKSAVPGIADGLPADNVSGIIGAAYTDGDFNNEGGGAGTGQDVVEYRVDTAGFTAPFTIEARLLYQTVRPGFVYGMHHDDQPRVTQYKEMYEIIPPSVEVLATDVVY